MNAIGLRFIGKASEVMEEINEYVYQWADCKDCLDSGEVKERVGTDVNIIRCHCDKGF